MTDGTHAAAPAKLLGTHRAPLGGLAATQRFVVVHVVCFCELREGRLYRVRAFLDAYDAAVQLGVLPKRGTLSGRALLLLRGFGYGRRGGETRQRSVTAAARGRTARRASSTSAGPPPRRPGAKTWSTSSPRDGRSPVHAGRRALRSPPSTSGAPPAQPQRGRGGEREVRLARSGGVHRRVQVDHPDAAVEPHRRA